MDILKIFRMQEPVSRELLTKSNETSKQKETIIKAAKDITTKNQNEKIKELETENVVLKDKNKQLEAKLAADSDENEFQKIMRAYEKFIAKVLLERQQIHDEKKTALNHLANLEVAFSDLLEKYDRAKLVVEGYKNNEELLKNNMKKYEDIIDKLNKKYEALRLHSESRLSQANLELTKKNEGNIHEVAKLKAKILQSQAKISELEKHVKFDSVHTRSSMFAPLQSNIVKQK